MRQGSQTATFGAKLLGHVGAHAVPPSSIRPRLEASFPRAAAILAPDDADVAAEILGICSAEGWPVAVAGAAGRAHDARPVVVLTSCRMNRVTDHEPADLVVGAESGIPLRQLQRTLAAAGQWLPLDPPDAGHATLGGAVAAGAAGPLRALHGTARDMVLGVEVVTGDGRRLRFGGQVVKNVAGYDAVRMLVGSCGRLGMITHAFLRLRGAPKADRTLVVACGAGAEGAAAAARMALAVRARSSPDALEIVGPGPGSPAWKVIVRLTGTEAAVSAGEALLRDAFGGSTMEEAPAHLWNDASSSEAAAPAWRSVTLRPTDLPDALRTAARLLDGPYDPSSIRLTAHAADGVVRVWGDSSSVVDPIAARLTHPKQISARVASLTRHLYAAFDPAGILQPPETPTAAQAEGPGNG